ncbi:helicase SNF2 [bacterium]|nr:helicase SNF2 [bacterium]
MSGTALEFGPGTLVKCRGRDWVVQPGSTANTLSLRPLGGSEEDIALVIPELEIDPLEAATFTLPDSAKHGSHQSAGLLRDAIQLKLRNGAGPFRSFGNIAVEPRAYQMVPLLMALRLPVVRLLIADDVGIGKTIEAALIVRELIDRGEISRFAVLCPPHLVEQWQVELENRFHLRTIALTSASANRIERSLPPGVGLFEQFPYIVVSLDYIKSERHRNHFISIAPECIIVDEAHARTTTGQGKQLGFELLQQLAENHERHIILLTATPHSGDNDAFYNLLSLLRPEFALLREDRTEAKKKGLREELAKHFVQRRRIDIEEWQDSAIFPRRLTTEITYALTGAWGDFFDEVRNYCVGLASKAEQSDGQHSRMIWYATLALLRCVSSSPAAALKALSTRLSTKTLNQDAQEESEESSTDERVFDGGSGGLSQSDLEPAAALEEESADLRRLIAVAQKLSGKDGDPKLAALLIHIKQLLKDGFRPVIFCRYVATAHYIAEHLAPALKGATVEAITGEFTPDERKKRIEDLQEVDQPVLVATDCLSEGINLQHIFTAVVHYDLAWNPSRHEQREGRVDRFGQKAAEVRATMLYGQDNPIDGFILNVILRKAEAIRKELGVLVPLPTDEQRVNQALIKAALMKGKRSKNYQEEFDFAEVGEELQTLDTRWQDAKEKMKANRTIFAQRRLKPDEVMPEWEKQKLFLGDSKQAETFVAQACARLNAPLEPFKKGGYSILPQNLPENLRERLAAEDIARPFHIFFDAKSPVVGAHHVQRTHPVVALLADTILEDSLSGESHALASRCSATVTDDVRVVTTLFLFRLRHQLTSRRKDITRTLMAEECVLIAAEGRTKPHWLEGKSMEHLLGAKPAANLGEAACEQHIQEALEFLNAERPYLEKLAYQRASDLLSDHRRVREASGDVGAYQVVPCLPVDVLGVYVLLPSSV